MKPNVLFRLVIGQPTEADAITVVFALVVLMRRLYRRDNEMLRRDKLRFAHHVAFVRAVPVDSDQQRRVVGAVGNEEVVIKIDLGL